MARLTKEQWLEARQRWEADPTETYRNIGEWLGVAHSSVLRRAKNEEWVKSGSLLSINRAAQLRADTSERTAKRTGNTPLVLAKKKPLPSSIQESTELRAKLIQAHRAEWRKHAELFPLVVVETDSSGKQTKKKISFDECKTAKISAEMISIRQKGERIAWGMDNENVSREDASITAVTRIEIVGIAAKTEPETIQAHVATTQAIDASRVLEIDQAGQPCVGD